MANFSIAWSNTKQNEGGFVDNPADPGGYTYAGITRKNFPDWSGWPQIEAAELRTGQYLAEVEPAVEQFYIKNFWNPIRGDEINDQNIANITFDMAVNKGVTVAVEGLQNSANLPSTGIMDDATLSAVNNPSV